MSIVVTSTDGQIINGGWNNVVNEDGSFAIQLIDYYLQDRHYKFEFMTRIRINIANLKLLRL